DEAGDRGDVDDPPAAAAHGADRGVHEPHGGLHVHAQVAHLVVDVVVGEVQRQAEAGVVHEEIDPAPAVRDALADPVDVALPGEVGGEHFHGDAVLLAQSCGQLLQRVGTAGDDHEIGAVGGQLSGELRTQSCAGSGDECGGHQRSYPRKR